MYSLIETDTSLPSLKFTEESSMDGMSLEQVVDLLDKNIAELSPCVTKRSVRHSTPEKLEVQGREVKTHLKTTKPGTGIAMLRPIETHKKVGNSGAWKKGKTGTKKVRNYNS